MSSRKIAACGTMGLADRRISSSGRCAGIRRCWTAVIPTG